VGETVTILAPNVGLLFVFFLQARFRLVVVFRSFICMPKFSRV
jgi:hypothetical protein